MVKTDGRKEEKKKKNKWLKDNRRGEYNARDKKLHKGKVGDIWSPNFLIVVTVFAFSFFLSTPNGHDTHGNTPDSFHHSGIKCSHSDLSLSCLWSPSSLCL